MSRQKLTPITELNMMPNPLIFNVDSLSFPVGLDIERIGVHTARLERAIGLIGTSILVVDGYSGEEDEYSMSGTIQSDGSLLGAQIKMKRAEKSKSESKGIDDDLKDVITTIHINTTARNQAIGDIANQYKPEIHASALNKSLRKELFTQNIKSNMSTGSVKKNSTRY